MLLCVGLLTLMLTLFLPHNPLILPPPPPSPLPLFLQLDLLAYTGYMYVPLVLNCLCGLIGGRTPYFVALAYTAFALGYFTSCTLRPLLKDRNALGGMGGSGGGGGAAQANRTYVEYGAVVIQVLLLWWLGPKSF